ncbi:hypothetical protein GWI33_011163, partial [Rhynchophorus ferrugineus]
TKSVKYVIGRSKFDLFHRILMRELTIRYVIEFLKLPEALEGDCLVPAADQLCLTVFKELANAGRKETFSDLESKYNGQNLELLSCTTDVTTAAHIN